MPEGAMQAEPSSSSLSSCITIGELPPEPDGTRRVVSAEYAGRPNANSSEWPEIFTIPGIPRVRHEATGQPYFVSRQANAWKTAWNFEEQYMVGKAAAPDPLTEPMILAKWREGKLHRPCSEYGSGMPQFHRARENLLMEHPEDVFADPNNPLLKQLIAERNARRRSSVAAKVHALSSNGQCVVQAKQGGSGRSHRRRPQTADPPGQIPTGRRQSLLQATATGGGNAAAAVSFSSSSSSSTPFSTTTVVPLSPMTSRRSSSRPVSSMGAARTGKEGEQHEFQGTATTATTAVFVPPSPIRASVSLSAASGHLPSSSLRPALTVMGPRNELLRAQRTFARPNMGPVATAQVPGVHSETGGLHADSHASSNATQRASKGKAGTSFYLIASNAASPEPVGDRAVKWCTVPMQACARETAHASACEERALGRLGQKRAAVPLHGLLRPRDGQANRTRSQHRAMARDVAAVRDLF